MSRALILLFLASMPAHALAQDDADARARVHFDSARVHFDEGEYESARAEFQAAYDLSHRDALLYNLYLCEERLGHLAEATGFLERFLSTSEVPDDERPTLERRLGNLRERLSDTAMPVDSNPPEVERVPAPRRGDGDALFGAAIGTLAAGGAALVVTAILGGLAAAEDAQVGTRCGANAGRVCTDAELQTLADLSIGADVALTAGLVLAATGVGLAVAGALSPGNDAPRALLMPTTGGALLVVGGVL